jgi:hypothetical protein
MTCPYLDYSDESADQSFDVPRAYCTVVEQFVQPMRADVCNDRYDLDHAEHCEYFLAEAGDGDDALGDARGDASCDDGDTPGDAVGDAE